MAGPLTTALSFDVLLQVDHDFIVWRPHCPADTSTVSGGSTLAPGRGGYRPLQIVARPPHLAVLLTHCGQLILRMSDFKAKMHQIRFPLALHPTPRWGSLQR